MVNISAIIITLNEEEKIARCIDSLIPVADEIVVVDSYSTDNTKQICEARNVRFIQHTFEGHIEQKNFALSQATYDYILSLDADEYLSPELTRSILEVKKGPVFKAYSMNRLSSLRGRWIYGTDWYPDRKIRLWHRDAGKWGGYNPHDLVIITQGVKVKRLEGSILHVAYDSFDMLFKKAHTYASVYARANAGVRSSSAFKILYKSTFSFLRNYILRRGIFYGFDGLAISFSSASYTFFKYSILRELNEDLRLGSVPTTLIVTTYNRTDALELVLKSVLELTVLPDEVIVADDGSKDDTRQVVEAYAARFPVPLRHCWHADEGFRLAMIRNKAIAMATCPYIVMIDGDMVMPPDFIADHKQASSRGRLVQGSRVLLGEKPTQSAIEGKAIRFSFFSGDIGNRKNMIRSAALRRLFSYCNTNVFRVRGANMAFWRSDVIAVNGFNEDFTGWGREDSEFVARMLRAGFHKFHLKFAGFAYHLAHPESGRDTLAANERILQDTVDHKRSRCINGIDKYL